MKVNRFILLGVALIQPFMLHSAETAGISAVSSGALTTIAQAPLNEEQITALATSLHAHAKNNLGLDIDYNAPYLIHRIKLFLSFRAHQHKDISQEASTFCYINQLNYTTENLGPKFTELQTRYGAPSLGLFFKHLLMQPAQGTISETTIAYDFSVLLCQYWQNISTSLDKAQTNIDLASSLTTLARKPLTQDQIVTITQESIARCITPHTRKYEATLQKRLSAFLAFRSKVQRECKIDQSAGLIIKQQTLNHGNIQTDQHSDTTASSLANNKQSWNDFFKNKLLIKSADEQAEISWANETASLLVQYWSTYAAYKSRKKREEIKKFMDNVTSDAITNAQPSTIAKVSLTQDQITVLAQQAIASCMTPQIRKYKETFQRKLAALLTFRSQLQSESLSDRSAELIIKQQSLHYGYIQTDQHDGITSSSPTSNTQRWSQLFKNKLLTESADEQAEITWAHETASLLVKYWLTFVTNKSQKNRELVARKRDKASGSVEETQELLPKNRRCNDSPAPFVSEIDTDLFLFDSPMPIFTEDYFQIGERDES